MLCPSFGTLFALADVLIFLAIASPLAAIELGDFLNNRLVEFAQIDVGEQWTEISPLWCS